MEVLDGIGAEGVTGQDAGELGGAMACGSQPGPEARAVFTCAWVDEGTVGTVTFPEGSTSAVRAASTTLEVREAVTV